MVKKVALALGGGGAKFFTHLGMISVLQEHKIPIDYMSSSSMGSIAAALIANKIPIETIKKEFYRRRNFWSWATPSFKRFGFMSQKGITKTMDRMLENNLIEKSKIIFSVTSANILDGKLHLFEKGDINTAVKASCAFPGVFVPIELDGKMLVDGGVLNNIPADICRKKIGENNIVISSSVDAKLKCKREDIRSPFDIYQRIIYLPMYEKRHKTIKENSDFFLEHFANKTLSLKSGGDIFKVMNKKALESFYALFTDDFDRSSLLQTAENQLCYINSLPSNHITSVVEQRFTRSQLADSLELFIRIVKETPETLELNNKIKTAFHVYQAGGRTDRWRGEMLATGYYEPLFRGSLNPDSTYKYPLYKRPRQLISRQETDSEGHTDTIVGRLDPKGQFKEFWSRSEIETNGHLHGQELVYLKDRFEVFLLHVQGSGRIQLPDDTIRTVRFAGHNGHSYNSIGKLLVDEKKMTLAEASVPAIRSYLASHPEDIERVLYHNPRFIFFAWGDHSPPNGSMGVPLTAGRSIAIDRKALPAELIAYLVTDKAQVDNDRTILKWVPLRRFVMPQDTGAAIKGPGRVDLFLGSDAYSEVTAGNMKQKANLFFLIAKE